MLTDRSPEYRQNCWIYQQVTIGWRLPGESPVLGDKVYVGLGAKVLGAIRIGSSIMIGANAVVIADVPDNCTVVGVPAPPGQAGGSRRDETRLAAGFRQDHPCHDRRLMGDGRVKKNVAPRSTAPSAQTSPPCR
jgi:serine acetyltransferase